MDIAQLTQTGAAGLLIFLCYACFKWLIKQSDKKDDLLKTKEQIISDLHAQSRQDALDMRDVMKDIVALSSELTNNQNILGNELRIGLQTVNDSVQHLTDKLVARKLLEGGKSNESGNY